MLDLLVLGAIALVILSKPPSLQVTATSQDVPRQASPYPLPPGGLSTGGGTTSIFGSYGPVAEKVVAGLTNIIEAARATDTGKDAQ